MEAKYRKELEDKFLSNLAESVENDCCLTWTGKTHEFGYGLINWRVNGKREHTAHRLAWYLANGDIPKGAHVLHRCDNPSCCRARHLFLGTHLDNVKDMHSKKRHPIGDRHPMAKLNPGTIIRCRARFQAGETLLSLSREFDVSSSVLHRAIYGKGWKGAGEPLEQTVFGKLKPGESHPKAKLTEDIVREARRRRAAGAGVTDLAREFGIGKATMSKVLLGKYWKHVT